MNALMNDLHLVLHGLAIRKHADAAAVAALTGLPDARVSELLQRATASGRAVEAQGAWLLSPAGRMILDGQYSRVYATVRADPALASAYARFERINTELKRLITDWQTVDVGGQMVRNDHANSDYDAKILDRLGDLHDRFAPLLGELTRQVPRLGVYARKLENALEKAEDGAIEWVSDARLDSYHTVWFELHEDLLRILGRVREE